MAQEIHKFHETFNPILEILKNGQEIHSREMQRLVIEKFYSTLPQELLKEKTKSGEVLINNRIAWGKSYLKKGGYIIYPQRGFVQITAKGLEQKNVLDLKTVVEGEGSLNFYKPENIKSNPELNIEKIDNASPQDLIDKGFEQIEFEIKNDLLPFMLEKAKDGIVTIPLFLGENAQYNGVLERKLAISWQKIMANDEFNLLKKRASQEYFEVSYVSHCSVLIIIVVNFTKLM